MQKRWAQTKLAVAARRAPPRLGSRGGKGHGGPQTSEAAVPAYCPVPIVLAGVVVVRPAGTPNVVVVAAVSAAVPPTFAAAESVPRVLVGVLVVVVLLLPQAPSSRPPSSKAARVRPKNACFIRKKLLVKPAYTARSPATVRRSLRFSVHQLLAGPASTARAARRALTKGFFKHRPAAEASGRRVPAPAQPLLGRLPRRVAGWPQPQGFGQVQAGRAGCLRS
jgi:hypothetical protein